jgi:hypothetical protein
MVDEDSLHNIYLLPARNGMVRRRQAGQPGSFANTILFFMSIDDVYSIIALRVKIDQWQ